METLGITRPAEALRELVRRRTLVASIPPHIKNMYTILPDTNNSLDLMIDIQPDIIHVGHVHLPDAMRADNKLYLVTPNWAWNERFEYMPRVAIVDLSTFNVIWRGL
jgi:DNA polymerase II small subunit/DNA polymerase delta subunit B